jgi:hypothetical protein
MLARKPGAWWSQMKNTTYIYVMVVGILLFLGYVAKADVLFQNLLGFLDSSGQIQTFSTAGNFDDSNPFNQSLGTNGRTCATCHQQSDGLSVTPAHIQARFNQTNGTDPIFRTNDGANCPTADVSTVDARRSAYSLLLNKGLIRIELPVPANADFTVIGVDNPYTCSSTTSLSMYRRPLPSTNLKFLTTVMWDGRESFPGQDLRFNLSHQAQDATAGHAQGAVPLTQAQIDSIVDFELEFFTAQGVDNRAGRLDGVGGAFGGPQVVYNQQSFLGINDPLGGNPSGVPFDPKIFNIYDQWSSLTGTSTQTQAKLAIARGQQVFNSISIPITGVAGLNDVAGAPRIMGFCGTCHDTPNVGNHSVPLPINIGIADVSRRTPDMPVFTIQNNATGEVVQTTDPGRAMVTGKFKDIGKFKGPILRGLASRAPYFHDGSAATLLDVVNFYDNRFNVGFTQQQKSDLVAFLGSL